MEQQRETHYDNRVDDHRKAIPGTCGLRKYIMQPEVAQEKAMRFIFGPKTPRETVLLKESSNPGSRSVDSPRVACDTAQTPQEFVPFLFLDGVHYHCSN